MAFGQHDGGDLVVAVVARWMVLKEDACLLDSGNALWERSTRLAIVSHAHLMRSLLMLSCPNGIVPNFGRSFQSSRR